jgi:hypothetical protein
MSHRYQPFLAMQKGFIEGTCDGLICDAMAFSADNYARALA